MMLKTLIVGIRKLKSVGINIWELLWLSVSYLIKIVGYYLLRKLELKKLSNLCVIVGVTLASLSAYLSDVFCKLKKKDYRGYKIFYRLLKREESKVFVLTLKVCLYLLAVVVTLEYFVVVLDYFIIKFGGKVGDIYNFELRENLRGKYLGVDSVLGDTDVGLFYYSQVKIIKLAVSYFLKVNYVLLCNGVLLCFLGYLILIYSILFGMNLYLQGLFSCLIGLWILTGVLNSNYNILNLLILNLAVILGCFGIDKDFIENWYLCKDYQGSIPVDYTYVIGFDYIVEHLNNDEDFFSYDEADKIYEKDDLKEIYSGPEMAEFEYQEWDFVCRNQH